MLVLDYCQSTEGCEAVSPIVGVLVALSSRLKGPLMESSDYCGIHNTDVVECSLPGLVGRGGVDDHMMLMGSTVD
jgi:hypothetical protein